MVSTSSVRNILVKFSVRIIVRNLFKVYDSLFSLDAVYRIRHRRTQGAADNRNKGY